MDLSWLRYGIALSCLLVTASLLFTKKNANGTSDQHIQTAGVYSGIIQSGSITTGWTSIEQSLPQHLSSVRYVSQGEKQFLLIDTKLVSLSSKMYNGQRTGEMVLSINPLIVYYRYEIDHSSSYTFLYQEQINSSRELGNLRLIGYVNGLYLFSRMEKGSYYGLSALVGGNLQTLYTGSYQTVLYSGNQLQLNSFQIISLPSY